MELNVEKFYKPLKLLDYTRPRDGLIRCHLHSHWLVASDVEDTDYIFLFRGKAQCHDQRAHLLPLVSIVESDLPKFRDFRVEFFCEIFLPADL